jgi:putative transposase
MSAQAAPYLYVLPPAATQSDEWLTAEQVMEITGWSDRWLRKQSELGNIVSRKTTHIARNGRHIREYLAASLPKQQAGEAEQPLSAPQPAQAALALFASLPSSTLSRVTLPDPGDQAQAEQRLAILQPILGFNPDRHAQLRLSDGRAVTSRSRMVLYQAETHGVAPRTLKMWLKRYRTGGFPALADKQRSDKNTSRWFAQNLKAAYLAAYLYLECRQSYRAVHEAILADRELLGITDVPHYDTVRAWLQSMPAYLTAYAREGRRAYQERMAPYITRGYSDVFANQVWVSDHMIHDVEVMNDCFPEAPYGAPIRLRFTCLLDFCSRYVVGASWAWEGSSRSIATAMRRAFAQHGPCEHFYCDNGKDYLKVAKGAMPAYLAEPADIRGWYDSELRQIEQQGILARLGIKVTHCIVRHPQSKHVERFFRTLHEQFDKRFYQHYTGGASHLRPDATAAAMEMHRKLMKHGRVDESLHPPASAFIALCMAWIEEYHQRPHSGEGMDGRTPAEVFAAEQNPRKQPAPALHDLALLLAEQTRRKVRECAIELNKRRYVHYDAISRDVLHEMNEREVVVAYDPLDPEAIAVLDEDGHFLCWARAEEKLSFDPADKMVQQRIGESMADRRHLEKAVRNTLDSISLAARANGARTPFEALAERAKVSSIVEGALTHRAPKLKPVPDAAAPPSAADIAAKFLEALK